MPAPAWHADPFGRHDHRFWDGSRWTDQVADKGLTASDPVRASDQAPLPGEGAPDESGGRRGRRLGLLVGLGVVVAAAVAVAAVLVLRGDDTSRGAGDYTLTVSDDEVTTQEIDLQAGDAFYLRVEGDGVRAALGLDAADYERLRDNDYVERTDDVAAAEEASDFFSDVASGADIDTDSAVQEVPGFTGVVVARLSPIRDGLIRFGLVAPVSGTYRLLLISDGGEEEVEVSVRTTENPDIDSDIGTDDYSDVADDDFFTEDFREEITDEFGDDTGDRDRFSEVGSEIS